MALSIQSTPGITIYTGMVIDEAVLNQMGNISVTITGTVGPTDMGAGDYSALLTAGPYFYGTGTLSAGVYTVALETSPSAYETGMLIAFKTSAANTGAVNVQVGALASLDLLKPDGSEFAADELPSGIIVAARHNGTAFQVISPWVPRNLALAGTLGVAGACTLAAATFSGTAAFNGSVALGSDSADTVTLNGTLAGSPTVTSKATPTVADLVLLQDAAASNAVKQATVRQINAAGRFVSTDQALPGAGAVLDVAHGLGAKPSRIAWELVCQTSDLGWSAGDTMDAMAVVDNNSAAFTPHVDAGDTTNVSILRSSSTLYVMDKGTGSYSTITTANWRLRVTCDP